MNAITPTRRMKPGQNILDRHKRAARMLGFALAADSPDTWQCFATVMMARLSVRERGAVTMMMCLTLPDEDLSAIVERVGRGAGMPSAPFSDIMGEAALWASSATTRELRAYLVTAFKALPKAERREFLDFAGRKVAA